jgi:predicted nucleic acid-binding protein
LTQSLFSCNPEKRAEVPDTLEGVEGIGLCKEAQADFLITGDKDLLNLHPEALKKNGISCQIINPASFLEIAP